MKTLLVFLCALTCVLHAEKSVQCISNFPVDASLYTQMLQEHGFDATVVCVDIDAYAKDLRLKKGLFPMLRRVLGFGPKLALPEEIEKVVFFNIKPKVARKYDLARLPKDKLVLFLWEPRTVIPEMYSPAVLRCFSRIYTCDDTLVDGKTFFKFHYPVLRPMLGDIPAFEEKKLCTLVASDLKSTQPNELYSERKKAISFFESLNGNDFEFYGRRWDPSLYKNYRGTPIDKVSTLKDYRFVLCYENTAGMSGYITEKIFDCFAAGTVPVYWGAGNVADYIPQGCFVDRRIFADTEELYRFLKSVSKAEYEDYLAHIKAFLASDAAKKFTLQQLSHQFFHAVVD